MDVSNAEISRVRLSVSCLMSLVAGVLTGAIVGGFATSNILSAISASWVTDKVAEIEASTILTDGGRRCKNSCRMMALSSAGPESPRSCCIRLNSCDGLQSPNSSAVSSC